MNTPWLGEFPPSASLEDIFYCFRLILGRRPSEKEWPGHSSRLGDKLQEVVATYVNSQEFHNRGLMNSPQTQHFECAQLDGFAMFASPDDIAVGKHLLWLNDYEPHVSHPFRSALRPGMRVLDIGANIGFYSLLAASRVGSAGEVLSVEPNAANVALILRSSAKNNFKNVRIIQAAAYDAWEPLKLFVDSSNGAVSAIDPTHPNSCGGTVMGLPLSAVIAESHIDVVKIDVEGAEGRAMQGMWNVIERSMPVVFSEFTPDSMPTMSGISAREYLQLFLGLGYHISVLDKSGGRIECGDDPDAVMHVFQAANDSHIDLLFQRGAS